MIFFYCNEINQKIVRPNQSNIFIMKKKKKKKKKEIIIN